MQSGDLLQLTQWNRKLMVYLKNDKALHKGGCFKVKVELI